MITFAAVALVASQVLAHEWGYGGHGGHEVEKFGFKGALRGKGSVWRYGDKGGHDKGGDDEDEDKDKDYDCDKGHGKEVEESKGHYHWSHHYCQKVCEQTPGCRNDPQAHGSYCKFQGNDGRPAVCFGLYRIPKSLCRPFEHGPLSRKYCFEPFSRHCNDHRLQPVRCDRKPKFDKWGAVIDLEIFLEGDDHF